VPDGGRQREDALQDAGQDSARCSAAVSFEVNLVFAGVEDGLGGLAQRFEEPGPGSFGFALAGRAQQCQPCAGEAGLEVGAEVVLVPDEDLARAPCGQLRVGEDVQQDLALVGLGAR
jgi:hypothetical protein